MTYDEAIHYWFGRVNYEQKTPQPDDLKLQSIRALLHRLGNPHERLRIVHVAGSKGKGSTSAMLAAILQAAAYRVGLFTSPHLVAVEERVQVDGTPISHAELAELMAEIRDAASSAGLDRELTFFEIGTALGFLHFVRRRTDFAIMEVGLGGRFDSTNVCRPLASIITSISLDHTQVLGNTVERIAFEKAGIVKPGRPTISGVRGEGPRHVIAETCRAQTSPLRQVDTDFSCEYAPALVDEHMARDSVAHIHSWRRDWPGLHVGLIGAHQAHNAAVAVAAVEVLAEAGISVSEAAVARGLADVQWPARLEILERRPLVVMDCAHNVASAQALVVALTESFPVVPPGRRLLVFAGSSDKDLAGMLAVLSGPFARIFLTRFQSSPRAVPPEELAVLLPAYKQDAAAVVATAAEAWRMARQEADDCDLICVTGSVFLAGELRPVIVGCGKAPAGLG
jgi:dihydrofolate synthase/folylpolyglutamate synthase